VHNKYLADHIGMHPNVRYVQPVLSWKHLLKCFKKKKKHRPNSFIIRKTGINYFN